MVTAATAAWAAAGVGTEKGDAGEASEARAINKIIMAAFIYINGKVFAQLVTERESWDRDNLR